MKRYTLYKFPSFHGTPKEFNWKWIMFVYRFFYMGNYVWEYQDNKTEKYYNGTY